MFFKLVKLSEKFRHRAWQGGIYEVLVWLVQTKGWSLLAIIIKALLVNRNCSNINLRTAAYTYAADLFVRAFFFTRNAQFFTHVCNVVYNAAIYLCTRGRHERSRVRFPVTYIPGLANVFWIRARLERFEEKGRFTYCSIRTWSCQQFLFL